MKQSLFRFVLGLSLGSFSLLCAAQTQLQGQVVDELNHALVNTEVSINGEVTATDAQGYYQLAVSREDTYSIKFNHQSYFPMVQTFSHYELAQGSDKPLKIKDITLVKKVKGRILLAFGGDVMMGRRYAKPYFGNEILIHPDRATEDTKSIVKHIKPYMSLADFAAVNLETQITEDEPAERAPKSVTFFSPPQILDALQWAGIDYVTLGNNHTYDYLDSGLQSTLEYLGKTSLGYSGAGLNQQQALIPYRTKLNGQPYSMLGFVGWEGGFSPNQTASDDKGGAAFGSLDNIVNSVSQEVKSNRTAIVQYHGSLEYKSEPTITTEQRLKAAIDNGAALAIAHHPHVTQGFEIYKDKLIAYSMGNFIFDQYIYASAHSMILYVWMDGDKFHRAEIAPIYLKGYKPTPATGEHRYRLLRRLTHLSAERGVTITASGGHGVINPALYPGSEPPTNKQYTIKTSPHIMSLWQQDWSKQLQSVTSDNKDLSYRLGVNLANGSDFESFATFDSNERGWNIDQSGFALTNEVAFSGSHSMGIELQPQQGDAFAMTSFRRVYQPGSPMTAKLAVKTSHDTIFTISWQGQKTRDTLFQALNESPKNLIEAVALKGSEQWQLIEVPFNSPRVSYLGLRMIVDVKNISSQQSNVYLDDVAFIEWQSAFIGVDQFPRRNEGVGQASVIEFMPKSSEKDLVELIYQ